MILCPSLAAIIIILGGRPHDLEWRLHAALRSLPLSQAFLSQLKIGLFGLRAGFRIVSLNSRHNLHTPLMSE